MLLARNPSLPAGMAESADDALIARIRAGDASAYEPIMRRYNRRLFRVTRSILSDDDDAQDAMQEAYVRAFTRLDEFRLPGNFGAWLTRIAVNEALMIKRRSHRFAKWRSPSADDEDDPIAQEPTSGPGTEDAAANRELRRLIEAAVDDLPVPFRTVFVLRALEQLSVEETATCLDIPVATVKTRFHRARSMMQQSLDRHIEAASLTVFDFAGPRCDRMVAAVLARLSA